MSRTATRTTFKFVGVIFTPQNKRNDKRVWYRLYAVIIDNTCDPKISSVSLYFISKAAIFNYRENLIAPEESRKSILIIDLYKS